MTWVPAFTSWYDHEKLDLILPFLEPDTFALDVGGCFGFYTIPMGLDASRKGAQVIAFEAVPANQRILQGNIERNHLTSVAACAPMGLGRNSGIVSMIIEAGGAGNAFVFTETLDKPEKTEVNEIQMMRLDDVDLTRWTSKSRCSLIKMDIEGFELEALAGAEDFVRRHRPVIFGEFNPWFMERNGVPASAIQDWANDHHYRSFDLRCERQSWFWDDPKVVPTPLRRDERRVGADLLLVPDENADFKAESSRS